tara:strand:+ start:1778 stop:2149 length:372 start_codon:yes stop_codon:yes gene_type:complete
MEIDIKKAKESFEALVMREMDPPIKELEAVNLQRYGVTWNCIIEKRRDRPKVVMLRRMVSKVFRDLGFSYKRIAKTMKRDHASVIYNVKVMDGMLDVYPDVQKEWKEYKRNVSKKISNKKRSE